MTPRQEIELERRRQIQVEGWSAEHDAEHSHCELTEAAIAYYLSGTSGVLLNPSTKAPVNWPWDPTWWKPHGKRRDLVRAGALILAERDRMRRMGSSADLERVVDNWQRFIERALDVTPKRIRLYRLRDRVIGTNAKGVARPSRFGNPWRVGLKACGHRSTGECGCNAFRVETAEEAVANYRTWLHGSTKLRGVVVEQLAGKDLACWCHLDRPCHGDVLLEFANPSAVLS
jgi:hypothetical protein